MKSILLKDFLDVTLQKNENKSGQTILFVQYWRLICQLRLCRFLNVCPFDDTTFVVSGKVGIP